MGIVAGEALVPAEPALFVVAVRARAVVAHALFATIDELPAFEPFLVAISSDDLASARSRNANTISAVFDGFEDPLTSITRPNRSPVRDRDRVTTNFGGCTKRYSIGRRGRE